ncbi:hypothetical protein [Photobacterium angustum]|uniref:hypothetical protein n=1 Tax=Photobacterium angustum TaxID=661 RepID=UPI0005E310AB|nr:hypothetical protein [Photobacterium angustum]KJF93288.1 hypothetical protein UB39_16315 [Photobacterium angustum]KJG01461.1 hypothetical protein UB35_12755 [Photobacterium angustum]KJG16360.1 hypothetical protein UA33_14670 [Photobacterium angustum]KJG22406.1 hypothetical protein UA39_14480 [Photobacterium angustum]KJG28813.1 hypothetical protein UA36_16545 [Photobacterium angustum]
MNFTFIDDDEILLLATPIMDNLMDASTRQDHSAHVRDFTPRLKAIVTKDYLKQVCEKYQSEKGFFTERFPVAMFKRPDSVVIVWKQFFSKAEGEFMAEMVLVCQEDRILCDHVMVL